jgi:hypothetical protein
MLKDVESEIVAKIALRHISYNIYYHHHLPPNLVLESKNTKGIDLIKVLLSGPIVFK